MLYDLATGDVYRCLVSKVMSISVDAQPYVGSTISRQHRLDSEITLPLGNKQILKDVQVSVGIRVLRLE